MFARLIPPRLQAVIGVCKHCGQMMFDDAPISKLRAGLARVGCEVDARRAAHTANT
jgi:hypothetical protein